MKKTEYYSYIQCQHEPYFPAISTLLIKLIHYYCFYLNMCTNIIIPNVISRNKLEI